MNKFCYKLSFKCSLKILKFLLAAINDLLAFSVSSFIFVLDDDALDEIEEEIEEFNDEIVFFEDFNLLFSF